MIRLGVAPYLECSSRGDKRFSAFYARPKALHGKSIEEAYQAMKVFEDGSTGLHWREAKGRLCVNISDCQAAYTDWWKAYVSEHNLLPVLLAQSGLSDIFGQTGSVCQAAVLWAIRNGE